MRYLLIVLDRLHKSNESVGTQGHQATLEVDIGKNTSLGLAELTMMPKIYRNNVDVGTEVITRKPQEFRDSSLNESGLTVCALISKSGGVSNDWIGDVILLFIHYHIHVPIESWQPDSTH